MTIAAAKRFRIRGTVQGVGFRPHVYRLAARYGLAGWILNDDEGVDMHVEGDEVSLAAFAEDVMRMAPAAAYVDDVEVDSVPVETHTRFEIRESLPTGRPTTRLSVDLPVCDACLRELFDGRTRRFHYPYINCTDCGPRFSIVTGLPYDRSRTTMSAWAMCDGCTGEYRDPLDRRFHAQPIACPACGPSYRLLSCADGTQESVHQGTGPDAYGSLGAIDSIARTAELLRSGRIVAVKGIGGYHLACDATNAVAVAELRERKFRKEQAFAVMVRDLTTARATCHLSGPAEALLLSSARPVVLAPSRVHMPSVAPDNDEYGLMLPYAPLHHLLFALGAPERLVMTSGNRSGEPIAYLDDDAVARLGPMSDALLVGERPIARRVDDSVVRAGALGPVILRRSRGYAPGTVASLPTHQPVLALGADLKNTVTLVVDGRAYMSQHIGDLEQYEARRGFVEIIHDLMAMYAVDWRDVVLVHDAHPGYVSTALAAEFPGRQRIGIQHHRAHVASVLAERGELHRRVIGVALDGTGYGDDGSIWGGEFFVGSVFDGFARVAHLRPGYLPGGDAAARCPAQAAAGFVTQLNQRPELTQPPFLLPRRYQQAEQLVHRGLHLFSTTSAGRLFDTVAALVGFTRPVTFEAQAAIWLEQLARQASSGEIDSMTFDGSELDWRPSIAAVIRDRQAGLDQRVIARGFHRAFARGLAAAAVRLIEQHDAHDVVMSGGVAQNDLLLAEFRAALPQDVTLLINRRVPANDGGVSLGQAALAIARRGNS